MPKSPYGGPARPRPGLEPCWVGQTIRVTFNHQGTYRPSGHWQGLVVSANEEPPLGPAHGETWDCFILSHWDTGMMVSPTRRIGYAKT